MRVRVCGRPARPYKERQRAHVGQSIHIFSYDFESESNHNGLQPCEQNRSRGGTLYPDQDKGSEMINKTEPAFRTFRSAKPSANFVIASGFSAAITPILKERRHGENVSGGLPEVSRRTGNNGRKNRILQGQTCGSYKYDF